MLMTTQTFLRDLTSQIKPVPGQVHSLALEYKELVLLLSTQHGWLPIFFDWTRCPDKQVVFYIKKGIENKHVINYLKRNYSGAFYSDGNVLLPYVDFSVFYALESERHGAEVLKDIKKGKYPLPGFNFPSKVSVRYGGDLPLIENKNQRELPLEEEVEG